MGRQANLLGDQCTGHGGYPPRQVVSGVSSTVYINGKPCVLDGAQYLQHCSNSDCHTGVVIATTGTVFVQGRKMSRTGDPISCGSFVLGSSSNVLIGN